MLAEELLAAGDIEGCAEWKRIVAAINVLQSADPGSGEKVHGEPPCSGGVFL